MISIKKFEDFKDIVDKSNLVVFYTIEGDDLDLYADSEGTLYHIKLVITDEDQLDMWFDENFDAIVEVSSVEDI